MSKYQGVELIFKFDFILSTITYLHLELKWQNFQPNPQLLYILKYEYQHINNNHNVDIDSKSLPTKTSVYLRRPLANKRFCFTLST